MNSEFVKNFEIFSLSQDVTNTTNNDTNPLGCATILFEYSSNQTIADFEAVGLCPDFVSVPIISSTILAIQIIMAIVTILLVCIRRNKEPIKARSAFMISLGIFIQTFGVFLMMFRLSIGRAYYPCALYMYAFICGNVIIILPYMLRLYRLFIVMRINGLKLEFSKIEQVEVLEQKDTVLDNTTIEPTTAEEREFISHLATRIGSTIEKQETQEISSFEHQPKAIYDKDVVVTLPSQEQKAIVLVPEAMIVKPEAIAPTSSEEEGQTHHFQEQYTISVEEPTNSQELVNMEGHTHGLAVIKTAKMKRISALNPQENEEQPMSEVQNVQTDPHLGEDSEKEDTDTVTKSVDGHLSISKLLSAEISSYFSSEKRTRLQKRIKLLRCMINPFLILSIPIISLVLHFILLSLLEVIQVVAKQTIFTSNGSLFDFSKGCGITLPFTVVVLVLIIIHILMVFILFLINIRARDTYFIKYEVVIMLLVYTFIFVWFMISSFIPFVSHISDNFVPYALIIQLGPYVDTVVTGIIPMLRTFSVKRKPKKPKQEQIENQSSPVDEQLEGLQLVLNDSTMRLEFLGFAKRSFCPEFILCWQEIVRYRASKSRKKRIGVYEHIVQTFMKNNSVLELNLPSEERQKYCDYYSKSLQEEHASLSQAIKRKSFAVQKHLEANSQTFGPFELDELKKQVEFNMIDLFLRFKSQTKVKKFLKRSKSYSKKHQEE